jgi:Resolvase, N terminal domain
MTTVGYARVSSLGQDLAVQLEKLKGCDKIFKEKRSGVDAGRPELKRCLEYLREGDTLLVTKLDRLARSAPDLYRIISLFLGPGVELDRAIGFYPQGRIFFQPAEVDAEAEQDAQSLEQHACGGRQYPKRAYALSNGDVALHPRPQAHGTWKDSPQYKRLLPARSNRAAKAGVNLWQPYYTSQTSNAT